ncbi:hypothetical protein WA026_006332 [Henosepilachna vigintioctopunctata]|uniref:Male-enhanced antigen 1 n=1 Tax=Henosepilachna vigintioctopunctata TaxID=420089 RepID=A0AAW1TR46_9CUCU
MVYTNIVELPKNHERAQDEMIAAVLSGHIESVPEDNYFRSGYELLPQEPENLEEVVTANDLLMREINENTFCDTNESSPNDDPDKTDDATFDNLLTSCNLNQEVMACLDSPPVDIEMNSAKVEEVKQVMVNITLPPSAIPEWAAKVPEEEWKEYLFNKLHIKHKK